MARHTDSAPSLPVRVMDFRGTYKGGGGPDKTILNSAAQHDKSRVDVLVAYLRQPDDKEFQIAEMAKSLAINYIDFVDHSKFDWGCIQQIKKTIIQKKISLLHSHDDKTLLYSVVLKYLVSGLRIMHTCHSHSEYTKEAFNGSIAYWKYALRKKLLIWLMAQHYPPILTISQDTKQRLARSGIKQDNIKVLHNGIDINHWHRSKATPVLRGELKLNHNDFLVGTVARITYDKDLPTFFEVAKNVSEQLPNVKFVIVGDGYGEELAKAQKKVKDRGMEKIIFFTGHRTDLLDIYSSFDIFLMTSLTEGLPNTLLEAMAMEVPVVSTSVGGVPELVTPHKNGLLCPVGDAECLYKAIIFMLKDPQTRQTMADNSRKYIENEYNFSKRVAALENFYVMYAAQ